MSRSLLTRLAGYRVSVGLWVVCLAVLLAFTASPAWSQATSSSSISGLITDQQNAAVAGAEVKIVDTATGTAQVTVTNDTGRYVFVNVSPGTYTITVSKEGFTVYKVAAQHVETGATLTINAGLTVGSTATTVEVTAAAGADLQTTSAAVGTTMNTTSLVFLPNLGRDASSLAVLQPGTTPTGYVAGVFRDQNTFQLDGGNASSDMDGTQLSYTTTFTTNGSPTGAVPVPVESIEEFKVTSFNQTADFNGGVGSQIQMATKRGTNQWHGSGYEYYFATNLGAANSWKNDHTPYGNLPSTPLFSNHRSRFGGALGGQLIPKKVLGGKTYFFVNFEGYRFPNVSTYEHIVPSDLLRLGVVQIPNSAGTYIPYNLNPYAVTYNGVTYAPASCPAGACDPRGLGLNPIVKKIWTTQMPEPNDLANFGDHYNTQGYQSSLRAPQRSNSYVARIDHDFGDKWRFMASWRYTRYVELNTAQVDIGGALPGDTLGTPAATAPRDQLPSYIVTGVTTNITPTTTNSLIFNFTRNFWQWGTFGAPPQVPGIGGALEIGGESSTANLTPYTTNTQNVRRRYWDGLDKQLRDDLTMIKGNHLFQFGGTYARNYESHLRDDNGQSTFVDPTYISSNSGINFTNSPYIPTGVPSSQYTNYENFYSYVLGIVSLPQVVYVRNGPNLALQPPGVKALDHSILPSYNVYFTDTWHMKPTFTLNYGLGWELEMPPYETSGKQVSLVDQAGNPIDLTDFLAERKTAALNGAPTAPIVGFSTVRNVGSGLKYPFHPYYPGFSPRVSAAWNPKVSDGILGKILGNGKTVIRGGYGRIYGRLNGVSLVLVPLLGTGLLQTVQCSGASMTGQCLGSNNVDPTNAFRIGTDGLVAPLPTVSQTLPQPFYPGVNGAAAAGDGSVLDPNYRPNRTDNFTLTIQRELTSKTTLEMGYIGRLLRNEFQEINIDAVPYMTTLNGQSFAQAYAALYSAMFFNGQSATSVTAQPFFESALGGANSSYCAGFSSCTAALASKQTSTIKNAAVSDLWKAMNTAPSWTLGRTMISGTPTQATGIGMYGPFGYGNYNALFVTFRARDWHGITAISNFTWGRALGTGDIAQSTSSSTTLDPWNMQASYGPQPFDIKFLYNLAMYYQPPFFRGQRGFIGHILGGWTIAPLFTAQSGGVIGATNSQGSCTNCQAFGEVTPPASFSPTSELAVGFGPYTGGTSAKYNNFGMTVNGTAVGTNNPTGINMFANPAQVLSELRPCILGFDTSCGGYDNLRGLPTWNLDATIAKDIAVWRERLGATLIFQFTNILNHMQPSNPTLTTTSPTTFGVISTQANSPRSLEFGLRIHF